MDVLAVFATIVGLSAWMGSCVFLTFFVGPVIGRKLGPGRTADVMDQVQPRYYWISLFSGLIMIIGSGGTLWIAPIRIPAIVFMGLTVLALTLSLYVWLVLHPRMVSLRTRLQSSAGSQENFVVRERYDQAERLTSFLNFIVLLMLLGAAAALSTVVLALHPPEVEVTPR
jgi:hypothetical protein